ncbi:P-type DNA transfer ATPase VirB11 [Acidiphilium iwatense]|uniref:Type IV secretion system protein n=1 Tax=Acidiphilium iwatense TaxID=768198 RepID=A0ABS9E3U0_9PROT|nr:P-type DNA transfer ATPase VirB11 [Acidiphilium iwatense]MCF3948254.1 P-type DNA transfer ATPase VirB11 [Acidiphilium iwatense]
MQAWLDNPATEELCINRPGECWVRQRGIFERFKVPLDLPALEDIATLAGALRRQDVGLTSPLCATELPGGERLQVCLPPSVPAGTVSLTIRRPGSTVAPLSSVGERYQFDGWNTWKQGAQRRDFAEALALFDAGDLEAFLAAAVRSRMTILLCGATGSGKTTMSKTLIASIPLHERIITIEDTAELVIPQPNHVRLLYSKDGLSTARIDAEALLQASLRMRPDRVLLQELRDDAAWTYVNEVVSGHPGSITTIHGADPGQAFKKLFSLIKGSPKGAGFDDRTLCDLLAAAVDLIIPFETYGTTYRIGQVWFASDAARRGETAADLLRAL